MRDINDFLIKWTDYYLRTEIVFDYFVSCVVCCGLLHCRRSQFLLQLSAPLTIFKVEIVQILHNLNWFIDTSCLNTHWTREGEREWGIQGLTANWAVFITIIMYYILFWSFAREPEPRTYGFHFKWHYYFGIFLDETMVFTPSDEWSIKDSIYQHWTQACLFIRFTRSSLI